MYRIILKDSRIILIAVLLTLGSTGCTQFTIDRNFADKINVPIEDFIDIKLMGANYVIAGQGMSLYITNKTTDCVVFPYNYGLRIFVNQKDDWTELQQRDIFASHDDITMEAKGGLFPDETLFVDPDYSKLGNFAATLRMRIVIEGRLCVNGKASDKNVADYIELTLKPKWSL